MGFSLVRIRLFALLTVAVTAVAAFADGQADGWRLEWSDEFDGDKVNPAVWTFEEGWRRNNELQYYTVAHSENARIEDGRLVITARKEKWPNRFYDPSAPTNDFTKGRKEASYTSASLFTKGKIEFQYGRLEVRAKIPEGLGTWPAIWT